MRSSIICILSAFILLGMSACYKDKGNYDYTDINKVSIVNIEQKYTRMQRDMLLITPNLGFTDPQASDSARYTYEWIAMRQASGAGTKRQLLANTKNLRYDVVLPSGKYHIYYRLTDKVTDLQFQQMFELEVTTPVYEGWMVMTDVNGTPRLAMISKRENDWSVIPDVLNFTQSSLQLKGKPVGVNCMRIGVGTAGYAIYISTDQTTDRIDSETFEYVSTHNIKYEMLSNVPDNFAPSVFSNAGFYRIFMVEGTDLYHYNYTMNIKFGLPINILRGESLTFPIAPFVATSTRAEATCIYDIANKRFVRHLGTESTCSLMPDDVLFDFNTGMDLVWMDYTEYNEGNVMAVLHDAPNARYYFARFIFGRDVKQLAFDEITTAATDIAAAKKFAISPNLGYTFYSAGGKLYSYDMSLKSSKLMLDKGSEEITSLQFRSGDLVVASFDPSMPAAASGKLEVFGVPPIQGALELKNSWTGMGKIVNMSYRAR